MGVKGMRGGSPGQVHSSTDRHLFVGCLQHRLLRELDGPGAEAQGKSGVATGTITWREGLSDHRPPFGKVVSPQL